MVRDDLYEIKISNAQAGVVCAYDLHPDLWYDSGKINIDFTLIKNIEDSAVIRINKDNKYDAAKGLIAQKVIQGSHLAVDIEEYEKVRVILTTKDFNDNDFSAEF